MAELKVRTVNIRFGSGRYALFTYTNEYDENGDPINITIFDQDGNEITEPSNELITLITDTIPPFEPVPFVQYWEPDGANALMQVSDNDNLFLGNGAGASNSTGTQNLFTGFEAGLNNTTGSYNSFLSYRSGFSNVTGNNNYFAGFEAGYSNNSSNNTFLGYQSGKGNTSGQFNNFVGYQTGLNNTTGSFNTYLGYLAGLGTGSGITGNYNNGIGREAGKNQTSGGYNNHFGYAAGLNASSSSFNNNFGYLSGGNNTTGSFNNHFGYLAGRGVSSFSTSNHNNIIGREAGLNIVASVHNNFLGTYAGYSNTSGGFNNYIGYRAGFNQTTGFYNIFIGRDAGYNNATGSQNIFIGFGAGHNETGSRKLYISDTDTSEPLYFGDFAIAKARINGYLEVRDKNGTYLNVASWDGDKIIDSGVAISSLGQGVGAVDTMNFRVAGSSFVYEGLDLNGVQVGDPIIFTPGTGITLTQTGNGFSINSNVSSGAVDTMNFRTAGSSFVYEGLDSVGSQVGDPIIFTPGTNITFTQNGNGFSINAASSNGLWGLSGSEIYSHPTDVNSRRNIIVGEVLFNNDSADAAQVTGRTSGGRLTDVVIGANLTLSGGVLSASGGSSVWTESGVNVYVSGGREVGINTTNPTESLHVIGDIKGSLDFHIGRDIIDSNNSSGSTGQVLSQDSGGVVWKTANIAYAQMANNGTQSITATGSYAVINMGTQQYNVGYSVSGGYTPNVSSGYHHFSGTFEAVNTSVNVVNLHFAVYVGGSFREGWNETIKDSSQGKKVISFNYTGTASSSQKIELRMYKASSGTLSISRLRTQVHRVNIL